MKLRWLKRYYVCEQNPLGPTRMRKVAEEKVLQVWDFPTQTWQDVPTEFDHESLKKAQEDKFKPDAKARPEARVKA